MRKLVKGLRTGYNHSTNIANLTLYYYETINSDTLSMNSK